MLALMRQNISLNSLEDRVAASILDWGSSSASWQQLVHHPSVPDSSSSPCTLDPNNSSLGRAYPDVLLAADCVYFEPAFPLLRETLRELIGPNTTCYFCFKRRRRADASSSAAPRPASSPAPPTSSASRFASSSSSCACTSMGE